MKTLSPQQLKNVTLETTSKGFVVWIVEKTEFGNRKHWLLDASCLKEDSIIRLPNTTQYRFTAQYDKANDYVELIDTKIVKRKKIK